MSCQWITRREVAEYLRIDVTTVDRYVKRGLLKRYTIGDRTFRFCLAEVQGAMGYDASKD